MHDKQGNLYIDDYVISFFFMGLLYETHMGPIWATCIWANPYGTHAEPGCTPHMGSQYGTHIGMFAGKFTRLGFENAC